MNYINLIVCMSQAELPTPYVPSKQYDCSTCGQSVWLDAKYANDVDADKNAEIMCMDCGVREMARNPEVEDVSTLNHYREKRYQ